MGPGDWGTTRLRDNETTPQMSQISQMGSEDLRSSAASALSAVDLSWPRRFSYRGQRRWACRATLFAPLPPVKRDWGLANESLAKKAGECEGRGMDEPGSKPSFNTEDTEDPESQSTKGTLCDLCGLCVWRHFPHRAFPFFALLVLSAVGRGSLFPPFPPVQRVGVAQKIPARRASDHSRRYRR